jgi:hypothetical protein
VASLRVPSRISFEETGGQTEPRFDLACLYHRHYHRLYNKQVLVIICC